MTSENNFIKTETAYVLSKVWLETHDINAVMDNSEYSWLEFHLGDLKALNWIEFYLELSSDEEIERCIKEYEKSL